MTNGLTAVRAAVQIANPSPGGGRINVRYRQVECAPPSDLVVNVDNNDGGNGWIRLQVTVCVARFCAPRLQQIEPSCNVRWRHQTRRACVLYQLTMLVQHGASLVNGAAIACHGAS